MSQVWATVQYHGLWGYHLAPNIRSLHTTCTVPPCVSTLSLLHSVHHALQYILAQDGSLSTLKAAIDVVRCELLYHITTVGLRARVT